MVDPILRKMLENKTVNLCLHLLPHSLITCYHYDISEYGKRVGIKKLLVQGNSVLRTLNFTTNVWLIT